jgi:hypothetical protein
MTASPEAAGGESPMPRSGKVPSGMGAGPIARPRPCSKQKPERNAGFRASCANSCVFCFAGVAPPATATAAAPECGAPTDAP